MRVAAYCVAALALAGCAQVATPETACGIATAGLRALLGDGDLSGDQRIRGAIYRTAGDGACPEGDPGWIAVASAWDAR